MAGQNDFLVFDENKDNMLTQELYNVDEDRTNGFKKGLARSNVNNKVLHQTSKMAGAIGELIKGYNGVASDSATLTELASTINSLFTFKPYVKDATYKKDDFAVAYIEGSLYIARSLLNGNTGHDITDTTYWEEVELGGGSGYNLFDLKYSDHILEGNEAKGFERLGLYVYKTGVAGSRYGYPDFYNKCVAEKVAGTETTITVGDYSFTGYKNANGHIFFDIADKDTVDNIYTSTGKAWYYGVDTANERIFLPRIKQALVGMTDIANTSAVVPNSKNPMPTFTVHNDLSAVGNLHTFSVSGSPFNQVHWNGRQGNNNGNLMWTDKGNTGLLSDNANVKSALNNDNFYIYMCVGNTEQESAVTDVIDITTSENDTLPLGWSSYQSGVTPSSAFLASLGQQNNGTLYPSFYNEFSTKIGQPFGAGFVKAHTASDITDYDLVINQDEQTFRLPLLNGSEEIAGDNFVNVIDDVKTISTTISQYTLPKNGVLSAVLTLNSTSYFINLENSVTREKQECRGNGAPAASVKGKKGQLIDIHKDIDAVIGSVRFSPFVGNGTLYYKVSNAVQNLELLDVAEMTTALANKVDSTNTQWAVNACMPDYTAGVSFAINKRFIAPADGCVFVQGQSALGGNNVKYLLYKPDGTLVEEWIVSAGELQQIAIATTSVFPLPKSYSCKVAGGSNHSLLFYPLKGAQ